MAVSTVGAGGSQLGGGADALGERWGQDYFGTTRTLDQHVANLRRKLEKVGGKSQSIGTVHGVGYRYNPGDASTGIPRGFTVPSPREALPKTF
ncbi:MAG: helix-turn-helix domain-containing protein [Kiritimatiellia bacterium]